MTDTKALFALADKDDAGALLGALAPGRPAWAHRNDNGESLFFFALFRGRTKCVAALAARGELTLHEAAAAGDSGRVAACLAAAPWSIHSLSPDGWTVLHVPAFLGVDAMVLHLLELGADPRQMSRAFEQNLPIHAAAAGARIGRDAYAALLRATGDTDIPQKQGWTALMIAAANGFAAGVEALLAAGADPGRAGPDGKTASMIARERGHAGLAARLER